MEFLEDLVFKVCIFGDGGVGKTTLVYRYLTKNFTDTLKITIGVVFHIKRLELDGNRITLQLWDFAEEINFEGYSECSSKTGENVEEMFELISHIILEHHDFL